MTIRIRTLALAALAATAFGAHAQDTLLKLGVTYYDTHAKTTGITGVGVPAGADAEVGDAATAIFTGEYYWRDDLGFELVLGVPPKIKAKGSGSVAFLGDVLSAHNVAPTAFVKYRFGSAGDSWRPTLGVGVNYTRFTGAKSPYGWDVKMSDSWGWAVEAGLDYRISDHWGLFASVAALKVKSDLVAVGATVLKTTIDFRPIVYSAGVSYKF